MQNVWNCRSCIILMLTISPKGLGSMKKPLFVTKNNVFCFKDPTNLQGKIQKHQAFEAELNANQSRLDAVDNTGEQLIGDEHYASEQIRERLDELHKLWAYLFERSNDKGKMIAVKISSRQRKPGQGNKGKLQTILGFSPHSAISVFAFIQFSIFFHN